MAKFTSKSVLYIISVRNASFSWLPRSFFCRAGHGRKNEHRPWFFFLFRHFVPLLPRPVPTSPVPSPSVPRPTGGVELLPRYLVSRLPRRVRPLVPSRPLDRVDLNSNSIRHVHSTATEIHRNSAGQANDKDERMTTNGAGARPIALGEVGWAAGRT